jgi:hypothetical protein
LKTSSHPPGLRGRRPSARQRRRALRQSDPPPRLRHAWRESTTTRFAVTPRSGATAQRRSVRGESWRALRERWHPVLVVVGAAVHLVRRGRGNERPHARGAEAPRSPPSADGVVHRVEGGGLVHRFSDGLPAAGQRTGTQYPRIRRGGRSASTCAPSVARATHDQRHRLVLSGVYEMPWSLQLSGIVNARLRTSVHAARRRRSQW